MWVCIVDCVVGELKPGSGAERLSEAGHSGGVAVLCRPVVAQWGRLSGGGVEDFAQGLALSCGVVPMGLGLVSAAAAQADDGDGGVGQAGEVTGELTGTHAAAVFVKEHINTTPGAPPHYSAHTPEMSITPVCRTLTLNVPYKLIFIIMLNFVKIF